MQRFFLFVFFLVLGATLSGCISAPLQGLIYTGSTHHVNISAGNTIGPGRVLKRGESCSWGSYPFAYLFYYGGNASIHQAKLKAGITKIAVVDRKSTSILSAIFHKECVVVWGE